MQLIFVFIILIFLMTAMFISFSKRKEVFNTTAFSFCSEDDSDIKIAGQEPKPDDDSEAETEAVELQLQRENGNVAKGTALSKALFENFITIDSVSPVGNDSEETEKVKTERRLLLAFTAVTTVSKIIDNTILDDIIVNNFYEELRKAYPDFYEEFKKSGSFSFYTLCIRRGGEIQKLIGETFAMLCSKEGDPVYTEFGTALYLRFVDVIGKTVKSFDFK